MTQEKKKASQEAEVKSAVNSEDFFADFDFSQIELSLEAMLKSGMHFGHQKSRKHPKMEQYIYTTRKGINIINLEKTRDCLVEAMEFLKKVKKEGKQILFIGTKKQNKDLIVSFAKVMGMPFVVERWLGGTFTNFSVIRRRADYLKKSQEMMVRGEFKKYTKLEQLKKSEELEKLEKKMGGIKEMTQLPGAVFITDIKEDQLAIQEAVKAGVPLVAISDTNVNPSSIDFPIPANDDALSSLKLILAYVGKALSEVKAPVAEAKPVNQK